MASEIKKFASSGVFYFILIRESDGYIYDAIGDTWEAPSATLTWADNAIEMSAGTGLTIAYYGDMPSVAAGTYHALILEDLDGIAGNEAITDTIVGGEKFYWTGSARGDLVIDVNGRVEASGLMSRRIV